jgi:hypothetical protein
MVRDSGITSVLLRTLKGSPWMIDEGKVRQHVETAANRVRLTTSASFFAPS